MKYRLQIQWSEKCVDIDRSGLDMTDVLRILNDWVPYATGNSIDGSVVVKLTVE